MTPRLWRFLGLVLLLPALVGLAYLGVSYPWVGVALLAVFAVLIVRAFWELSE